MIDAPTPCRKKANAFAHPFLQGLQKPFVPNTAFEMPAFPTLPGIHKASPGSAPEDGEDVDNSLTWNEEEDGSLVLASKTETPNTLFAGDEYGRLHLLYGGSISLGAIELGKETDIISAFLCGPPRVTRQKSPFNPRASYATTLSLLVSVPLDTARESDLPEPVLEALHLAPRPPATGRKGQHLNASAEHPDQSGAQAVLRLTVDIPSFPSSELALLARASSNISSLLSHAFEPFDQARQAWEEANSLARQWLGRLQDDPDAGTHEGKSPQLKLLLLLLTGRPVDTDMHDFFANKNSERVCDYYLYCAVRHELI